MSPDIEKAWSELLAIDNDRAVGVLGGALLDDFLTEAILSDWRIDSDEKTLKARSNFIRQGGGVLTFGLKIDLAFLLKIIGPHIHSDLQTIKDIRNRFAHRALLPDAHQVHGPVTFDSQEIAQRCMNLWFSPKAISVLPDIEVKFKDHPADTPKGMFIRSVFILAELFDTYSAKNPRTMASLSEVMAI